MGTFDVDEKYGIMSSSPTAINIVPLKPVEILESYEIGLYNLFKNLSLIIGDLVVNKSSMKTAEKFYDSINSKTLICLPRILFIRKSNLTSEGILQLLSRYTKDFTFVDSFCTPNLSFSDIIKKAPNLDDIDLNH